MKKFIQKFILFLVILTLCIFCLNKSTDLGLKKSNYWFFEDWNEIFGKRIDADIIISGSSRSWRHFSPKILDSVTTLNSYNLGMDGSDLAMQITKYKVYEEQNKKPKYLIQMLDINTVGVAANLPYPEQFVPYFDDSVLRNAISKYPDFSKFELRFPSLSKYYGKGNIVVYGLSELLKIKRYKKQKYKGYCGNNKDWDGSFDIFKSHNRDGFRAVIDTNTICEFDRFLKNCESSSIKVFLVLSPEYIEAQNLELNRDSVVRIFESFALKYHTLFLNYSDSSLSMKKEYFYNSQHLNIKGAELFSLSAANAIRNYINPKRLPL
jgi:hypothetical protein